jgi:hypothetical protein
MLITFFGVRGIVHFDFVPQSQAVNQAYVEILKLFYEAVHRKRPELWSNDWILHHNNVSAHKALFAE